LEDPSQIDAPASDPYNDTQEQSKIISPGWPAYTQVDYPLYCYLASTNPDFQELQKQLLAGVSIQLIFLDTLEAVVDSSGAPMPPYHRIGSGMCGEDGACSMEFDPDVMEELRLITDAGDRVSYAFSLAGALAGFRF
jgi:hypothetical protein